MNKNSENHPLIHTSETDASDSYILSETEWKEKLSPAEYAILRKGGTEPAFSGKYVDTTTRAVYRCRACNNILFSSQEKFPSHCGWPSFFSPLAQDNIIERVDTSHGMIRTEVLCRRCHSHLGHVFAGEGYDTPTDLRYCINSICLTLEEIPA